MNHLNAADVATLWASAEEFRTALVGVQAEQATLAAVDPCGQATHRRNVAFREQITEIGNRFVAGLSPEALTAVRTAMGPVGSPVAEIPGAGCLLPARPSAPKAAPNSPEIAQPLPTTFVQCISSGTASTCTLPAGTYAITGSSQFPLLEVKRGSQSNPLLIEGAAGGGTIIERAINVSSWPTSIVKVDQNLSYITFEYLTIIGASEGVKTYSDEYFDFDLQEPGVWETTVENCTFNQQPGIAIYSIYFSYVNGNWFYFDMNGKNQGVYSGTDALWTQNVQSPGSFGQSTDIQFTNNHVYHSGGGATAITGSRNVLVQGNLFQGNQFDCSRPNAGGGQVGVVSAWWSTGNYYAYNVVVSDNVIDVTGSTCSDGTEIWGTDVTISENQSQYNAYCGIVTKNVDGYTNAQHSWVPAYITNNTLEYNGQDGISLTDYQGTIGSGTVSCPQAPPAGGFMFSISGNTIEGNTLYAIEGQANTNPKGAGPCPASEAPNSATVSLSSNTITGNGDNTPYYH